MYDKLEKTANKLDDIRLFSIANKITDVMTRLADTEDSDEEDFDSDILVPGDPGFAEYEAQLAHTMPEIDLTSKESLQELFDKNPHAFEILRAYDIVDDHGNPIKKYNSEDINTIGYGPFKIKSGRGWSKLPDEVQRGLYQTPEQQQENGRNALKFWLDSLNPEKNPSRRRYVNIRNLKTQNLQPGDNPPGAIAKPYVFDGRMPKRFYEQGYPQGHMIGFQPFMYRDISRRTPGEDIESRDDRYKEPFLDSMRNKKPDWNLANHLNGVYSKYPDSDFEPLNYSHRRFNPYNVLDMRTVPMKQQDYPDFRSNWYIPKKKLVQRFPNETEPDYSELEDNMRKKHPKLF